MVFGWIQVTGIELVRVGLSCNGKMLPRLYFTIFLRLNHRNVYLLKWWCFQTFPEVVYLIYYANSHPFTFVCIYAILLSFFFLGNIKAMLPLLTFSGPSSDQKPCALGSTLSFSCFCSFYGLQCVCAWLMTCGLERQNWWWTLLLAWKIVLWSKSIVAFFIFWEPKYYFVVGKCDKDLERATTLPPPFLPSSFLV